MVAPFRWPAGAGAKGFDFRKNRCAGENMEIQPLTLLTLTYLYAEPEQEIGQLLEKTKRKIARILNS